MTTKLAVVFALLCLVPAASADSILPIGTGVGTACQSGCAGNPNLIGTGANFDIANASVNELVAVLLAVPNDSTLISSITINNGHPGEFVGFDSSSNVYDFLAVNHLGQDFDHYKVPNGVGGDNLSKLEKADSALAGVTAAGYGIYLFEVGTTSSFLSPGGFDSIHGVNIPPGSFAFGLGSVEPFHWVGTPFTEAGLTTTVVPEPSTLFLIGTGLLGVVGAVRRKLLRAPNKTSPCAARQPATICTRQILLEPTATSGLQNSAHKLQELSC